MMKTILCFFSIAIATTSFAQKKFAQLDMELPTPNEYRNAAGAPGHGYFQQQADYKMNLHQQFAGCAPIFMASIRPKHLRRAFRHQANRGGENGRF